MKKLLHLGAGLLFTTTSLAQSVETTNVGSKVPDFLKDVGVSLSSGLYNIWDENLDGAFVAQENSFSVSKPFDKVTVSTSLTYASWNEGDYFFYNPDLTIGYSAYKNGDFSVYTSFKHTPKMDLKYSITEAYLRNRVTKRYTPEAGKVTASATIAAKYQHWSVREDIKDQQVKVDMSLYGSFAPKVVDGLSVAGTIDLYRHVNNQFFTEKFGRLYTEPRMTLSVGYDVTDKFSVSMTNLYYYSASDLSTKTWRNSIDLSYVLF